MRTIEAIILLDNLKSKLLDDRDTQEAINIAIKALEKQMSINPIIKSWSPALCPNCNKELSENLGDGFYKHYYSLSVCECGQKLRWED